NGDWAGVWYVAKDGSVGVLFAFRLASANTEYRFALPALEKDVAYCVRPFEGGEARLRGDDLAAGLLVTAD
ncbi:MAG: GH36 C-terminal domain-containing protein, partial [Anaerolineae bacterium]|nr:GH36 C-terminal domain-containing protein [Anaerolineae bacterium]